MNAKLIAAATAAVVVVAGAAGTTGAFWLAKTTASASFQTAAVSFQAAKGVAAPAVSAGAPVQLKFGTQEAAQFLAAGEVAIPFTVTGSYRGRKGLKYDVVVGTPAPGTPFAVAHRSLFQVPSDAACVVGAVGATNATGVVLDTGLGYEVAPATVQHWCLVYDNLFAAYTYNNVGTASGTYQDGPDTVPAAGSGAWTGVAPPPASSIADITIDFRPVTFRN